MVATHVWAQSLAPAAVCDHVAGDASNHLLGSPVLSVVVYKLPPGVHQVHDDTVVHLQDRYMMDTYSMSHRHTSGVT